MTTERRDRIAQSSTVNGIDLVTVDPSQLALTVTFLNGVTFDLPTAPRITGGDTRPEVPVADWQPRTGLGPVALSITVPKDTADFSDYTLTLDAPHLDPILKSARFSFKANCPSDFDCRTPTPDCAPDAPDTPPIDYLARDFTSFRQALFDFSAARNAGWLERSPADFGVMMLEALAATFDEFHYYLDRIAAEATLATATERRSVVRHARFVDYEPRPATAAHVLLRFTASAPTTIPAGFLVTGQTADGLAVPFEVGRGLIDPDTGTARGAESFPVRPPWNEIHPHVWDATTTCVPAGSTELWVRGAGLDLAPGQQLLLETAAAPGELPLREVVRVAAVEKEDSDPLPVVGPAPVAVTLLRLESPTRLAHDITLLKPTEPKTRTTVHGNLVAAVQGRTVRGEVFAIPTEGSVPATQHVAIYRDGPRDDAGKVAPQYLYPLTGPHGSRVAWLKPDRGPPAPQLVLSQRTTAEPVAWRWRRWLLDATGFDVSFTLDPARFTRIATNRDGSESFEYDGEGGDTLRFGGAAAPPAEGAVFDVTYTVADGERGNLPADTITRLGSALAGSVATVTNPFPAEGGVDPEPFVEVRENAPQAFQTETYRAVRPEDYRRAAEELPWVQRAGITFRWTGSWLTGFAATDPIGGREPSTPQLRELIDQMNRRRMAGVEVFVAPPTYASLDVFVEVCAKPGAFAGHVAEAVRAALAPRPGGFFDPDRFTFGTPLRRAALEAVVQPAPGVGGVLCVRYRRRGVTPGFVEMPDVVTVAPDVIIRVSDDPNRPDRGRVRVEVRGAL